MSTRINQRSLLEQWDAQVEAHPSERALACECFGDFTWEDLQRERFGLASALMFHALHPGEFVGIVGPGTARGVVSLLATWSCGAKPWTEVDGGTKGIRHWIATVPTEELPPKGYRIRTPEEWAEAQTLGVQRLSHHDKDIWERSAMCAELGAWCSTGYRLARVQDRDLMGALRALLPSPKISLSERF